MTVAAVLAYQLDGMDDGPRKTTYGWGLLICVCWYMTSFAIGWGGVPWVYPSEIFPMEAKEKALSTSVFSQWVANFLIAFIVPQQVNILGPAGTFLFYAVCLAGCIVFVYFCVPETKGLALEQMNELFGGAPSASFQ